MTYQLGLSPGVPLVKKEGDAMYNLLARPGLVLSGGPQQGGLGLGWQASLHLPPGLMALQSGKPHPTGISVGLVHLF